MSFRGCGLLLRRLAPDLLAGRAQRLLVVPEALKQLASTHLRSWTELLGVRTACLVQRVELLAHVVLAGLRQLIRLALEAGEDPALTRLDSRTGRSQICLAGLARDRLGEDHGSSEQD